MSLRSLHHSCTIRSVNCYWATNGTCVDTFFQHSSPSPLIMRSSLLLVRATWTLRKSSPDVSRCWEFRKETSGESTNRMTTSFREPGRGGWAAHMRGRGQAEVSFPQPRRRFNLLCSSSLPCFRSCYYSSSRTFHVLTHQTRESSFPFNLRQYLKGKFVYWWWLNCVPQNRYTEVLTPKHQNVTSFGKRVLQM